MKLRIVLSVGLLGVIVVIFGGGFPFGHREENRAGGEGVSLSRSSDKGNLPPRLSQVSIYPPNPTRQSILEFKTDGQDPDGDKVTTPLYRWMVNQKQVSEEAKLPLSQFKQGDVVSVEVTPFDGKVMGMPVKAPAVNIGNNLPMISGIHLSKDEEGSGLAIRASVEGSDRDGDLIRYAYMWQVNGKPVSGNSRDRLHSDLFHENDKIVLVVTPSDPYSQGEPKAKSMIFVRNHDPKIISIPPSDIRDGAYTYQLASEDSDQDPLVYALVEGPDGMTIDAGSGLLFWKVTPIVEGEVKVAIGVNDGEGGKSEQRFTIQMAQ